jgi:hypothetical protein
MAEKSTSFFNDVLIPTSIPSIHPDFQVRLGA